MDPATPPRSGSSLLQPLVLFALALAFWSFAKSWDYSKRWACVDYYQFWVVGRAVKQGDAKDLFAPDELERLATMYAHRTSERNEEGELPAASRRVQAAMQRPQFEPYSTPWLYTLFGLGQTGRYAFDQTVFQRASLIAYVLAVLGVCSMLGYSLAERCIAVAALLEPFGPYLEDQNVGNVGRMQLAFLIALAWLLSRSRYVLTGVLLGLGVAFQPNIASVALVLGFGWLVSGQIQKVVRVAVSSIVATVVAIALSSWFFGTFDCWTSWFRELPALLSPGAWLDVNFSLPRVLHELVGLEHTSWLIALVAIPVLVVLWRARRRVARAASDDSNAARLFTARWDIFLIGLGGTVPLLTSELAWFHFYIFVVPLLLYLLRPQDELSGAPRSNLRRALAFAALLAIAMDAPRMLSRWDETMPITMVVLGGVLAFVLACWTALAEAHAQFDGVHAPIARAA